LAHPYWPLFDLRLHTADLLLRPMTEADRFEVADRFPPDLDIDPALTRFPVASEQVARGIMAFQGYWKAYGNWTPESWNLPFAVFRGDTLIGSQTLEGDRFALLRQVDTASFLFPEWRGQGFGKQMRLAVLALAFDALEAESAITSAWHDNHASLGVSAALGYEPNGIGTHPRGDRADRMVHLLMSRARWLERGHAGQVIIEQVVPCRPFFGLAP
jgi:RimJ/RimL family protein N-acetyltransferase